MQIVREPDFEKRCSRKIALEAERDVSRGGQGCASTLGVTSARPPERPGVQGAAACPADSRHTVSGAVSPPLALIHCTVMVEAGLRGLPGLPERSVKLIL